MMSVIAQAKAQIDRDFPITRRRKPKMTPLQQQVVGLVSTASRPMRFHQLANILAGDEPMAPGWVDEVCDLADALNDLKNACVLEVSAIGWTKA